MARYNSCHRHMVPSSSLPCQKWLWSSPRSLIPGNKGDLIIPSMPPIYLHGKLIGSGINFFYPFDIHLLVFFCRNISLLQRHLKHSSANELWTNDIMKVVVTVRIRGS
jgi:hypothetical protein